MWNDISKEAFQRTFTRQLTESMEETQQAMAAADSTSFNENDIPICSICDAISLDCAPLPSCSHPSCPKCMAMAALDTSVTTTACRICAGKLAEKPLGKSEATPQTVPISTKLDKSTVETSIVNEVNSVPGFGEDEKTVKETEDGNTVLSSSKKSQEDNKEQVPDNCAENSSKRTQQGVQEVRRLSKTNHDAPASVVDIASLISMDVADSQARTLFEKVIQIQEALTLATKYSHCSTCLQAKKCKTPDLLCLDCTLSFCGKCCARHKCVPSNRGHIMIPVEESRRNPSIIKSRQLGLQCPTHKGSEMGMYCRNCEMLVCRECIVDHHLDCPGIVSAQKYASEERESVKFSRMRYAQVIAFFSEQQRNTVEMMDALNLKKKEFQEKIRNYFSTLIKACMDVEGVLLRELEESVTDHTDLLIEHSSAWLKLQECTQQILDVTDVLHFLPSADLIPMSVATKASLSQALQEGEALAAEGPAHMELGLCLEQSSKRAVIKRVKEIGAFALSVTTHSTLTLSKTTSMSFSTPSDKGYPQVTSMAQLTQTTLLAADFNNSCLKLLRKEENGEGWLIEDVLPLKWRPYAIAQLSEKKQHLNKRKSDEGSVSMSSDQTSSSSDAVASMDEKSADTEAKEKSGSPEMNIKSANTRRDVKRQNIQMDERCGDSQMEENSEVTENSSRARCRTFSRQLAVTLDEEEKEASEATVLEVRVAVTSPSSGCFIITVPVSGKEKMKVVEAITEDRGCWGVAAMDENTVALSVAEFGHCYISLVDMNKTVKWRLPLTSNTASLSLLSPRHIVAVSPTTMLVCDSDRKAIIQVTMDGTIFYAYRGHGNNQLIRPEGMCMDSQGYVYITDSSDDSVTVLAKGGILYSKTVRQQNDLNSPYGVCVDRNGSLYVANEGGKLLTIYNIMTKSRLL